jgi:hypothetical protein
MIPQEYSDCESRVLAMKRVALLVRNNKLLFSLIAVALFLASPIARSQQSQASKGQDHLRKDGDHRRQKRLKVLVHLVPNAPLAITSTSVDSSDANTPSISMTLINTTNSLIRAFTVRCDTYFGESKLSTWSLNNIHSLENCVRPQGTKTVTMHNANYSQPPQSAVLSVEFVEFLDGSRWGEDTYKSGERLDGWRAGARAEAESILKKIGVNGPDMALNDVRLKSSDVLRPTEGTPEYLDGFRLGVDAMRARVLHSGGKNKVNEIVTELQKPIDLSDRR